MKNSFILLSVFIFSNLASADVRVITKCNVVIDPNVGHSAEHSVPTAQVSLTRYEDGTYETEEDLDKRSGEGDFVSILAFTAGCHQFGKCTENSDHLIMKRRYTGGDEDKAYGDFNKKTKQLHLRYQEKPFLFYHTKADVLFQCE